jgi:hypothetical protein
LKTVKPHIIAILAWLLCGIAIPVQAFDPLESQVTAAIIFNFTKFVDWPTESLAGNNQLNVCIAGTNPFNSSKEQYQNRNSKGKTVRIRSVSGPQDVHGCNLLFIDQSEQANLTAYIKQTSGIPILTVSNIGEFASNHGIIGLFKQDDRMRFEINLEGARRSRLNISSNMLKLAKIVK